MSAELPCFKWNENLALLEQHLCVSYFKLSKPALLFLLFCTPNCPVWAEKQGG